MRLFEFDDTINASMMGLLAHLKRKAKGKSGARVHTKAFLNMLSNVGVKLDVNGLNKLKDSNPAISNMITSIDDEMIELNLGGGQETYGLEEPMDIEEPIEDDGLEMGGEDMMGEPAAPTMDDVDGQEMEMDDVAKSQNTVQTMAKKALSRRT